MKDHMFSVITIGTYEVKRLLDVPGKIFNNGICTW